MLEHAADPMTATAKPASSNLRINLRRKVLDMAVLVSRSERNVNIPLP